MIQGKGYRYLGGGPSIIAEILLPKKADYMGKLYNILTEGFTVDYKKYFLENKESIVQFFANKFQEGTRNFDLYAKTGERVYWGYSIYEVDGVFFSKDIMKDGEKVGELSDIQIMDLNINTKELGNRIYEERTQVIKLIFRPSIKTLMQRLNLSKEHEVPLSQTLSDLIGFFISGESKNKYFVKDKIENFKKYYPSIIKRFLNFSDFNFSNDEQERIVDETLEYSHHWFNSVGFFLIGYIVYRISNSVEMKEEEIWFTVNFDSEVYSIKK